VFASDLKTIYHDSDEEKARLALDRVTEKWTAKYPNSMKRWYDNWDAITPIFKFSPDVRKVIYTTNAIESLNSSNSLFGICSPDKYPFLIRLPNS
jgi:putative transposase